MNKTFNKIVYSHIHRLYKISYKGARQVTHKLLNRSKTEDPQNNLVVKQKNEIVNPSEQTSVSKKKKEEQITKIPRNDLINKYKLNLPSTNFSERLHHGNFEYNYIHKITTQFYNDQLNLPRDKLWITIDCPPFANGPPHIGTMYNKVLKDVTNRYKIILGYKVNFVNGFDCYGVEIEDNAVNLGKSEKIEEIYSKFKLLDQSRKEEDYIHKRLELEAERTLEIRKKCRSYVEGSIIEHIKNYLRWGIMCNMKQTYLTMDKNFESNQMELFKILYEKGLIYRDYRVVFWSIKDQRIIDDSELSSRDVIKDVIVFKCDIKFFGGETNFIKERFPNIKLLVFVQDPWKYVGIKALAINPEISYVIVSMNNEYYICAEKRLPELARRYECEKPKKLYNFYGSTLQELIANDPIFNRDLQILPSTEVSEKFGSGINAVIPAHDFQSEKLCAKHKVTMRGYVDFNGKYTNDLGIYFKGVDCFSEGGNRIIKKLQNSKSLFLKWDYMTTEFYNNKNQEILLLMSIPCFFLRITSKLKLDTLKELAFVKYTPELNFFEEEDETLKYKPLQKRRKKVEKESSQYENVIEALNDFDDWCISEFNNWGIPIPYFVYLDNGNVQYKLENKILVDGEVIDHVAQMVREKGSDIWWEKSVNELLPEKYKHLSENLRKGTENFDSWFDCSSSWYDTLIKEEINSNQTKEKINPIHNILSNRLTSIDSEKLNDSLKKLLEEGKNSQKLITDDKATKNSILVEDNLINHNEEQNLLEKRMHLHRKEFIEQVDELRSEGFMDGIKSIIPENILINYGKEKFIRKNEKISYFPADITVEGSDQHRDWFLLSSLTSVALNNEIPFKSIKTHGLVQDEVGNKMSKNFVRPYINPFDLTDGTKKLSGERKFGYGADTIRMWIIKNDYDKDMTITEKDLENEKIKLKIFRQFAKFCLGALSDYDIEFDEKIYTLKFSELEILEQIIIYEYIKTLKKVDENISNLNFRVVFEEIFKFINEKFSKVFIDSTKKLFLTLPKDSYERRSLQYILRDIFFNTLILLYPIIPFNCEDVYENINFLKEKKPYLGFEEYNSSNYFTRKYSFKTEENFEFNSLNLIRIKTEIDQILIKLEEMGLPRNQTELYFQLDDNSYEFLLLKSLKDKLSSFFNVALCSIKNTQSNEEERAKKKEIRKGTISFEQVLNEKTLEKFSIDFEYTVYKTMSYKCLRCLLHRCESSEQICEECMKNMKLLI